MNPFFRASKYLVASSVLICAQASTENAQKQTLLQNFEKHFLERNLGAFSNPSQRKITVVIEHSLVPPPEGVEKARLSNSRDVENWLRSKERFHDAKANEHWPFRVVRKGAFTNPNLFEYDNMGINHNSWNLSRVYFSSVKGKVFVTKFVIYDGD